MRSRELKKICHPRMGRYVYKHRGNGLIVDTLMKPIKAVASQVLKEVVKPFGKKAVKAGVSHAGERVGKKSADKVIEKSGNLIRKRLSQRTPKTGSKGTAKKTRVTKSTAKKTRDDVNMLINNLIARIYKKNYANTISWRLEHLKTYRETN